MQSVTATTGNHAQASGPIVTVIPFDSYAQTLEIEVSAQYAATAATSGLLVTVTKSSDGGSTYSALAPVVSDTLKPIATVTGVKTFSVVRTSILPVTHIKVTCANQDVTNICNFSVRYQFNK